MMHRCAHAVFHSLRILRVQECVQHAISKSETLTSTRTMEKPIEQPLTDNLSEPPSNTYEFEIFYAFSQSPSQN